MSDGPGAAGFQLAISTAASPAQAERIAAALVEERLAACVNIVPGATSIYRWEGKIHRDREVLLLLKTTDDALDALRERLLELHPYETPEFLAFQVASGAPDYLRWVTESVRLAAR